tara:strand:- start:1261 stop:1476 length:216 start_codon:yes stop_codon:yes gene_type:complete
MKDIILYLVDFFVRILKLIIWVAIAFLIIEIFLALWPGATIYLQIGEPITGVACEYMAVNGQENSVLYNCG